MISIIIPTYQEEKTIARTLKTLRETLTAHAYEILVADDGSTDRTREIARTYADRVVEIAPGEKRCIAAGKNRGARNAEGEFIAFIDADVRIDKPNEFFAHALRDFAEDSALVGLTCTINVEPGNATVADRLVFGVLNLLHRVRNNILHQGVAAGEFQMVRKAAFDKLHGYDERLIASEDYEFFSRLSKIGRTKMDPRLRIFHSGRRAHAIGWPRLLRQWIGNWNAVKSRGRAISTEWEPIR